MSTIAIFGAFALSPYGRDEQDRADHVMEQVVAAGVNHIDVAPTYGHAEARLGPWIARLRDSFFLGCKTGKRRKEGATAELYASLERLRTDHFDLYQLHAVTSMAELDAATAPGGALEALVEAREAGLTRYIGITGHGFEAPAVFLEALRRFDFDSVLFPINFILFARPDYRRTADELLRVCAERNVGTMIIKTVARGAYGDRTPTHNTWYEPFTEPRLIQDSVNFVLSQPVTGLCTPGDATVLPEVLRACDNYLEIDEAQQEALIAMGASYDPLFQEVAP
jgi:aryl-alcohol dehydrogenase-like predicted oxidoreductase